MKKPFLFRKFQRVYSRSCITQKRRPGTVIARYRYKGDDGKFGNVYAVRQDEPFHSEFHEGTISCVLWAEDYLTSFKVLGEKPAFAKA